MEEQTIREQLHDLLCEASVFYRTAEPARQQTFLDDIVDEFLGKHLDEVVASGLGLLDSLQRVDSGTGATEGDGWSW